MEHDENQVRARLTKLSYYSTQKEDNDEKKEVKKKKSKLLPQATPSVVKAGEIVQVFVLNLNFKNLNFK